MNHIQIHQKSKIMKRYIFPLILFVLLPGVNKTYAQQAATVTGSFKAPITTRLDMSQTTVNYTMTLSAAKDKLSIVSNSNDKTLFNVDVLNTDKKIVSHWSPSGHDKNFNHEFDISNLPPGSYHLNIGRDNSESLQSIPFTK